MLLFVYILYLENCLELIHVNNVYHVIHVYA